MTESTEKTSIREEKAEVTAPVAGFVKAYADSGTVRLHMPGHKGRAAEINKADITEIPGADSLYEADGIIAESEECAGRIFDSGLTVYSAEGSSLCIKTMCLLAMKLAGSEKRPVIIAGRNAHRSFIHAAELLDPEIIWLGASAIRSSLMSCDINAGELDTALTAAEGEGKKVAGVYITSPDYLGNMADIASLSETAHRHDAILICDNAHGAYLKFMKKSLHPLDQGADLVCDSAHKTLNVLTGGAYLHIGKRLYNGLAGRWKQPAGLRAFVKQLMIRFASTSPSYLILASLDEANTELACERKARAYAECAERICRLKRDCEALGYVLCGDEPLKLTVDAVASGLESGAFLSEQLRKRKIECEFADRRFLVTMWSPANPEDDLRKFCEGLAEIKMSFEAGGAEEDAPEDGCVSLSPPETVFSPREVLFMETEIIPARESAGRISADVAASCPPAVLPLVPGERISAEHVRLLESLDIDSVSVVKAD